MSTIPSNQTESSTNEYAKPPFIRRVRIQGYKSIAFCDVELQPLTILVGRNGSGKSNFLDALGFLKDAMETNVKEAVSRHGGLKNMICRSVEEKRFSIEIKINVKNMKTDTWVPIRYGIQVSGGNYDLPKLDREYLRINVGLERNKNGFERNDGKPEWFGTEMVRDYGRIRFHTPDNLLLRSLDTSPGFEAWNKIETIGTYNFNPEVVREGARVTGDYMLEKNGKNLGIIVGFLQEVVPERVERVRNYLSTIAPEIEGVDSVEYGDRTTIQFQVKGKKKATIAFDASSMSDGTLRAFAALIAAFQVTHPHGYPGIVGIEEPETALHPAAIRALVDALDEATQDTQIILTTHSPDLIRDPDIRPSQLLAVRKVDGETRISPIDPASRSAIEEHLYNAGELLQMDQLDIDEEDIERQRKEKYLGSEV